MKELVRITTPFRVSKRSWGKHKEKIMLINKFTGKPATTADDPSDVVRVPDQVATPIPDRRADQRTADFDAQQKRIAEIGWEAYDAERWARLMTK